MGFEGAFVGEDADTQLVEDEDLLRKLVPGDQRGEVGGDGVQFGAGGVAEDAAGDLGGAYCPFGVEGEAYVGFVEPAFQVERVVPERGADPILSFVADELDLLLLRRVDE